MSKLVRVAATLILLIGLASAQYHSVGEIFDQGAQTQAAVKDIQQQFKDFKSQMSDNINLIGMKNIAGFITAYIMLNCFAYLFKRIKDYINRNKIKHDRDKFVDNLKEQVVLQSERINQMEAEKKNVAENLTLYRQLFGQEFKPPQYNKLLFYSGILVCILGAILAYQGNAGAADLLLILGFLSLLVCGLLYLFSIRRYFTASEPIQCLANSASESHIIEDVLGTTIPTKIMPIKNQQTQDINKAEATQDKGLEDTEKPPKDDALCMSVLSVLAERKGGYLTAELQDLLGLKGQSGYQKLLDTLKTLQNEQKITFDMIGTNKRRWRTL